MHPCDPNPATSESAAVIGIPLSGAAYPRSSERKIFDKGPHIAARLHKRGGDVLDYAIDLCRFLRPGETVTAATAWTSPVTAPEMAVTRVEFASSIVVVWLAGGRNGTSYQVNVFVETSEGRDKSYRFFITVRGDAAIHSLLADADPIGVGAGVPPQLALSLPELEFPPTQVGESSAPIAVTVTNIGGGRATISAFIASEGFSTTSDTGGTLQPGDSFTLWVTFTPSEPGTIGGYITIEGNATADLILLAQAI